MKKIIACALMSAALLTSFSGAANVVAERDLANAPKEITQKVPGDFKQKMQADLKAIEEKWNKLTPQQKSELYNLENQILELRKKMIDSMNKYGVVDNETAKLIKEKMALTNQKMQSQNRIPMFGFFLSRFFGDAKRNSR